MLTAFNKLKGEKTMSDKKELNKKKLLLKLMIHNYDEEANRNELVDSKNSQMIVLTGAMLTLQATLFSNILVDNIISVEGIEFHWKIFVSIFMIISLILYTISMYLFIQAYTFKDKFRSVPNPNLLKYYNDESEYDDVKIIDELLKSFRKHINFNEKLINDKVAKGQEGFDFLKISGMFTVFLLIIMLIVLFL